MNRKDLLKVLSLGGTAVVSTYVLREYAPWTDYDAEASRARSRLQSEAATRVRMEGIIRYATLAANGHNAQAWTFALLPDAIEIHPDYSRRLPAVDQADRELWISLGCALENLLIASRAMGYEASVSYPEVNDFIRIGLSASTPQSSVLFEAIPARQSTRTEYDSRPIAVNELGEIEKMSLEPGIGMHQASLKAVSGYVHQATMQQYADPAFVDELTRWLRFDKKEALSSFDGLYSRCTGNPGVPRWLGKYFVSRAKPQEVADADVKKLNSSSGAILISSDSEDKTGWVRAGQVYQRMALTMTSLNIKSAFLNQPIEVEGVRSQLQSSFGLGTARPQMLVRFGYSNAMPSSLRRPIEQVMKPA
jgi:hypothetical protein